MKPPPRWVLALAVTAAVSPLAAQGPTSNSDEIDRLRKVVEEQRQQLQAARQEASAAEDRMEWELYLCRIALAQRDWQAGEVSRAAEILDACPARLRNWEWSYLRRLLHGGLLTLHGHGCVAYSPDGKRLASAGNGNTVEVWDASTGRELLRLSGHTAPVLTVAFSPDGKRLASGGEDKTVRVWDAVAGKELLTLRGHEGRVSRVAFAPGGTRLASACDKAGGRKAAAVRVWDAATGQELMAIEAHTGQVLALAFSPDGEHIATGGNDYAVGASAIKIWDAASGRLVLTLRGHKAYVADLAFSPDGERLASAGSFDNTVRVWDAATGQQQQLFRWPRGDVLGVAFSPDGKRLAASGGDTNPVADPGSLMYPSGEVRTWDLASGEEAFTIRGYRGPVRGVAYSPDGRRLTAAGDLSVGVWDASGPPDAVTFKQGLNCIHDLACSPDGKRMAVAMDAYGNAGEYRRYGLRVWETATGEEVPSGAAKDGWGYSLAFSPDGKRLAYGNAEQILVRELGTGKELLHLKGTFFDEVYCLAFSPDGKRLASGTGRHHQLPRVPQAVKVWDAATGRELLVLKGHTASVHRVAFSPDGKLIASAGEDGTVRVWDASTGGEVRTFHGPGNRIDSVAYSPDGRRLAGVLADEVRVWDVGAGKEVLRLKGHRTGVRDVAYSPDGKRLASADLGGTIKLWDAATGREVLTLTGVGYDDIMRVAFDPSGRRIAAAADFNADGRIRLWDASPVEERPGRPGAAR